MATGQLVSRANSDISLVLTVLRVLPTLTSNLVLMVASLGVMFYFSPVLALISLVILPMLVVGAYRMRIRLYPATWDVQQRTGDVAQVVDQAVTGVRVVKGFGQEHREFERLSETASGLYGSSMRSIRLQARYQPLLESIPSFGQVGVLALGGWLALHHEITVGTFLAFASYLVLLINPARLIARMLSAAPQARAGARAHLRTPRHDAGRGRRARCVRPAEAAGRDRTSTRCGSASGGPSRSWTVSTCASPPGRSVALVGTSGSGKSTAALLLSRFHDPQEGAVRIDGHDVRDVTLGLAPLPDRHGLRGELPVLRIPARQHRVRAARRHGRGGRGRRACGRGARVHPADARGL